LKETIRERLDAIEDVLQLTDDQRREIKQRCENFLTRHSSQRNERISLRKSELNAMSNILTPDQREKVKDFVNERHID
jgi:hypothetical protein